MTAPNWFIDALSRLQCGQATVVATIVGPPGHALAGRHLIADAGPPTSLIGDSNLLFDERAWNQAVSATVSERMCMLLSLKLKDCNPGDPSSSVDVFLGWCGLPPEAWIFGAGHIGQALSPLLCKLGWRVVVCDDRAEFVTPERFPDAAERRDADFGTSARACAARPDTWAILVTRGHRHDEQILRELRSSQARYIGMIGSRRRVGSVRDRLIAEGLPAEFLDSLHAPIGLPIGADSPMEIAVAIAGEMIAVRRRVAVRPGPGQSATTGTTDSFGQRELWEHASGVLQSGRPVVLATVVRRRGSTPRGLGAQMVIFADGSTKGTIGGGCGEGAILRAAKEMILGGPAHRLVEVDLTADESAESADVCGGRYTVFVELLS